MGGVNRGGKKREAGAKKLMDMVIERLKVDMEEQEDEEEEVHVCSFCWW